MRKDTMDTTDMSTPKLMALVEAEREVLGPGVNESIPMTRRIPRLSDKQARRDAEIAQELIYRSDVMHRPDLVLSAFIAHRWRLSHPRYWELLKLVWIVAGSRENYALFRHLFSVKTPWRQYLMTPEEEAYLKALPESFTVWRAAYGENDGGLSWSLDREWVERYAAANGRVILEREVWKSYVLAYIERRGESELLIL